METKLSPVLNSRAIFLTCVGLACAGLSIALGQGGWLGLSGLALAAGLAWAAPELLTGSQDATLQSLRRSLAPAWLGDAWFGLFIFGASLTGFQGGGSWGLALLTICAALAAWDLQAFRRRVYPVEAENIHLRAYLAQNRRSTTPEAASGDVAEGSGWYLPSDANPARDSTEADVQAAERAALERAHLRALGLVSLSGFGLAYLCFGLAGWLGFEAGILVGLGLGLVLAVILVVMARLTAS